MNANRINGSWACARHALPIAWACACLAALNASAQAQDARSIKRSPNEAIANAAGNAGLFLGVNQFSDTSVAPLKYAVNDAIALAHVFVVEIGLIPPARATLLISGQPSGEAAVQQLAALREHGVRVAAAERAAFLEEFDWLLAQPEGEASLLLVSFSSHGFDAGQTPYVLPADGKRRLLQQSAIDLNQVEADLAQSRAGKRLLLVDACRERATAAESKAASMPVLSASLLRELAIARGQAVWASCKDNEFSYEHDAAPHGVFTYFLLEGLRGKATADSTGLIRVDALKEYVGTQVRAWARQRGRQQEPWFEGPHGADKIPLAVAAERRAEVTAAIARVRELAISGELTVEEAREAEELLSAGAPTAAELARLQAFLELGLGRRSVAETRTLLAALPRGALHPSTANGGTDRPSRPELPGTNSSVPTPTRFASWIGRYMPMHSERPDGQRVMSSSRELRVMKIDDGVVAAELCERGSPICAVTGEVRGAELVLRFPVCTGRARWPEFEMTIGAGRPGAECAAWGGQHAGDRIHAARLPDRTITLVEVDPAATLIGAERVSGARAAGERRAEVVRDGQVPIYAFPMARCEIDVNDLCQAHAIRLRGVAVLADSVVKGSRSRRDGTVLITIIADAKRELGRETLTVARPFAALDVVIPRGTLRVLFEADGTRMSEAGMLMGLTSTVVP